MKTISPTLRDRIRRADPSYQRFIELAVVKGGHLRNDFDDWGDADTLPGTPFTKQTDGTLTLAYTGANVINQTTSTDYITDLDTTSTFDIAQVDWASPAQLVAQVQAYLHPKRTAAAKTVAEFACQVFRLHEVLDPNTVDQRFVLQPITGRQRVVASGTTPGSFTFDFNRLGRLSPVGAPPINGAGLGIRKPRCFVFIYALRDDGTAADNVGWGVDTGSSSHSSGGNTMTGRRLTQNTDGTFVDSGSIDLPRLTIKEGSYTSATLTYTSNLFDLGASPINDVELVGHAFVPAGTSVTFEVDDDTTTPFTGGELQFFDGDVVGVDNTPTGGADLSSLTKQQQYAMRVTLTTNSDADRTPTLKELGIKDVARYTFYNEVEWDDGARVKVDPLTLVGETTRMDPVILHSGERDYEDLISRVLSQNDFGDVEARVFWGGRTIARKDWLLWDAFLLLDHQTLPHGIQLNMLSPLSLVRGQFPPAKDVGGNQEREYYEQTGATVKAVWDDILSGQMGVAGRWIGSPPEESRTISNVVTDSDAKSQLDAVARLADDGYGNITSQGRITAVPMSGVRHVDVVLSQEELTPLRVAPGFEYRVPEYFVPYQWNPDAQEYAGEERYHHVDGLSRFGKAFDPDIGQEDDISAQWITTQAHAQVIASRQVNWFGTGLILWEVQTDIAYPEMEPGDVFVVPTDQFVAKDPNAARELRGHVWALGVVSSAYATGRRFEVWIQSYTDIISQQDVVTRKRPNGPDATAIVGGDVTWGVKPGTTTMDIDVDLTALGGYGERQISFYMSATNGFTPGDSNRKVGPVSVPTTQDRVKVSFPFDLPVGTVYLKLGIKDALTTVFGETEQFTSQFSQQQHVVYFSGLGQLNTATEILALFPMEEGQGTSLEDLARKADASVAVAGAGWIDGPAGGAYDINAAGNLTASHATAHDIGTGQDLTVDVVFRFDGWNGLDQYLVNHTNDYALWLDAVAGSPNQLFLRADVRDHANTASSIFDFEVWELTGKWLHIKWQYDSSASDSRFWVNGRRSPTVTHTGAANTGTIGNDLELGHKGGSSELNGAAAYFRVAKGLLSDFPRLSEVQQQESGQLMVAVPTGNLTLPAGDVAVMADATSGAFTVTLAPVADSLGSKVSVVKIDGTGNAVTVDGNASETINGATTQSLSSQGDALTAVCGTTNEDWWKV